MELYRNREWLYFHYVTKRMKLTDIQKMLDERHGIKISQQALYNWCKKFELLKYRGKGRSLKSGQKRVANPAALEAAKMRQLQRNRMKKRGR
jgi:hypothetical protein